MTTPLEGLDPEQLRAATAPRGPVSIIAGAGTGKTRTITHRIAHLVNGGFINPAHILAVTFTKRAAAELRERLMLMNIPKVQAKTFHAAALGQLNYFWSAYAGSVPKHILDKPFPLVARAARGAGVDAGTNMLKDLLGEIDWAKSSLISPEDYPAMVEPHRRDCPVEPKKFVEVFTNYESLKNSPQGIILDFADILLHTAAAIETNPGVADEFRSRYRSFVVDEYQDVTPLQQRVLDAWLGDRDDLTVVGDANQTIYSFNGATPDYLLGFTTRFPESTTVRLHRDYRSTPQVVNLANKVISKATGRAAGTKLTLEGQRPRGPEPVFTEYSDSIAEAEGVAKNIKKLIATGTDPSEIAVLYRINADSAPLEYALDNEGIGYQIKGGTEFFERREIREGLAAISQSAHSYDPDPEDVIPAVRAALVPVGLSSTEPTGTQERARWQSLQALMGLVEDIVHNSTVGISLRTVMGMLKERAESKNPPRINGVTLVTIHAAKGLEWDAVFLVGLTEGSLPIRYALKGSGAADAIEEERRLFYVGITRAREHLYLSWPQAAEPGGKANRRRTRFLDGLVPGEEPAASSPRSRSSHTGAPKNACVVCGTRLGSPELKILGRCGEHAPDTDHVLLGELRQWRSDLAKEKSVPAYVIMTDATLRAIVEHIPTTPQQLVAIPGIGPVKVEQFGEDIIAITSNYA